MYHLHSGLSDSGKDNPLTENAEESVVTGYILIIQKDNSELTCPQEQQQQQITYPYSVHDDECDINVKETKSYYYSSEERDIWYPVSRDCMY